MKPTDVHALFGQTGQAIGPLLSPMQERIQAAGLEGTDWFLLAVSHDFEPDLSTPQRFHTRFPYTNPLVYTDGLIALVDKGLLEPAGAGEYRISPRGRQVFDDVTGGLDASANVTPPIQADDLARVIALMGRLVEAAVAGPEPPDRSHVITNRSSDPGPDGKPLFRILQYVADMNAFRDDAHLCAWRHWQVSGPAWEALTFVWRDEAQTAAELAEKLPFRRYSADDYTAALNELATRGWVEERDGLFYLTEAGRQVREEAEALTDRYYYSIWKALTDAEVGELGSLLGRLIEGLKALHPQPEGQA